MTRNLTLAVVLAALLVCANRTHAATVLFDIFLDGLQETPPVATPATGTGTLTLNDITGGYTIAGSYQDLIAAANNAHIHGPAAPGVGPAGVVVGLTFDPATAGNFSGAGTFTAGQMTNLLANLYYVNIHSGFKPGGEIRGQIVKVPEPGSMTLLACGALALLVQGWRRVRACAR